MDHELERTTELVLLCKKCKKAFRKDLSEFEDADEYCPHCDNHYVIEAKTPFTEGKLVVEFGMEKGHDNKMFIDEREKKREKALDFQGTTGEKEEHEDYGDMDIDNY